MRVPVEQERGHDRSVSDGLRLDGAVAVVTGGASGIGAACCRLLAASGAEAHVVDRDGDPPSTASRQDSTASTSWSTRQA